MARIICDVLIKGSKKIWGNDPSDDFNQRILSVNNMYAWLYEKGILEKASFEFRDYKDAAYFALNVQDLLQYRKDMESSPASGAALAVQHIFDVPYTPCTYSGAIELGWTMSSYRNVDGCVGRSWECGLVKNLDVDGIYKVAEVKDSQGVRAAVQALFSQFDWKLTLPEQARYQAALQHYNREVGRDIENEYVQKFGRELIFCFENGKTIIDFDFWTCYEELCGEKLTFEEYCSVDGFYEGDPHEIQQSDIDTITGLKAALEDFRGSRSNPQYIELDNTSLAQRLVAFYKDFDFYGYQDSLEVGESEGDAIVRMEKNLDSPDFVTSLREKLVEISHDEDLSREQMAEAAVLIRHLDVLCKKAPVKASLNDQIKAASARAGEPRGDEKSPLKMPSSER